MYKRIMVPVDLAQSDTQEKAIGVAADIARLYQAPITFVGVTETAPGAVARNPEEYGRKLADFARREAAERGIVADARSYVANDPAVELDDTLLEAARDVGADLVVMATHAPRLTDRLFGSHGGGVASHAGVSVLLVR